MRRGLFARVALGVAVMGGLLSAPTGAQAAPTLQARKNLVDSCVTEYDPRVDYFPEKVSFTQAKGVKISYHKHYKLIEVTTSQLFDKRHRYALVQCGTPVPANLPRGTVVIEVPVRQFVSHSVPHIERLGLSGRQIRSLEWEWLDSGKLEEIKAAQPGVFFADVCVLLFDYPSVKDSGLKLALFNSCGESTPLGRAEWVKFMAVFFNAEGGIEGGQLDPGGDRRGEKGAKLDQHGAGASVEDPHHTVAGRAVVADGVQVRWRARVVVGPEHARVLTAGGEAGDRPLRVRRDGARADAPEGEAGVPGGGELPRL